MIGRNRYLYATGIIRYRVIAAVFGNNRYCIGQTGAGANGRRCDTEVVERRYSAATIRPTFRR